MFLKIFAKFKWKHLCQSRFFNKVASFRTATLLKKRLWHRHFPLNFANFLRTPSFTGHLRWLLSIFAKSSILDVWQGPDRRTQNWKSNYNKNYSHVAENFLKILSVLENKSRKQELQCHKKISLFKRLTERNN